MTRAEVYVGSVIITSMSEAAWNSLGEGEHPHVVTQVRNEVGEPHLGASLVQHNSDNRAYIVASGTIDARDVYEVKEERISLSALVEMARNGMAGMASYLEAHYHDQPIEVSLIEVGDE